MQQQQQQKTAVVVEIIAWFVGINCIEFPSENKKKKTNISSGGGGNSRNGFFIVVVVVVFFSFSFSSSVQLTQWLLSERLPSPPMINANKQLRPSNLKTTTTTTRRAPKFGPTLMAPPPARLASASLWRQFNSKNKEPSGPPVFSSGVLETTTTTMGQPAQKFAQVRLCHCQNCTSWFLGLVVVVVIVVF